MDNLKTELLTALIVVCIGIIGAVREKIMGCIVEYIVTPTKRWFRKDRFDHCVLSSGKVINDLLVSLRVKAGADRASIYLFHNGQHFNPKIINNSIWKFTCAYEHCKEGVTYECPKLQNILVTNHIMLIEALLGKMEDGFTKYQCPDCEKTCDKNIIIVMDVAGIPYGSTKALYESQGVKKMVISPIIIEDDYVGFIAVTYSSNFDFGSQLVSYDKDSNTKGLRIMCEYANKITYQLSARK